MSKKEKDKKLDEVEVEQTSTEETEVEVDEVEVEVELTAEEKLQAENAELQNQVLRQRAEFENYKRRTQKEKTELSAFVKADCVTTILGVIDNFERALEIECADENFKKGIDMIFHQFKENLTKLGVEEIEALNQPFNPELHSAVAQVEDENFEENTVSQVYQKGYKLGDKVIRHSMVVVANP